MLSILKKEIIFPIIVFVLGGLLLNLFNFPFTLYTLFFNKEKEISISIKEYETDYSESIGLNGINSQNLFIYEATIFNSGRKQINEFNIEYVFSPTTTHKV